MKLTFPIVALSALLALLLFRRVSGGELVRLVFAFGLAGAAGFAMGAPLALVNWEVTLNGFSALFARYNAFHAPHSLIEPSFVGQLLWTLRFFAELYWPWFLLILLGLAIGSREERLAVVVLCAPFFALVLYFATKNVFFERNFAHAMPLLLLAGGAGAAAAMRRVPNPALALLAFGVVGVPGLYWSYQIGHAARWEPEERRAFEVDHGLTEFDLIHGGLNLSVRVPPPPCGGITVLSFRDPWIARYESNVRAAGYREVTRYSGPFAGLAPSTLQIYVAHDRRYFERSCGVPLQAVTAAVAESWAVGGYHESVGMPPIDGEVWASYYPAGDAGVGDIRLTFAVSPDTTVLNLQDRPRRDRTAPALARTR